jgi:hypothetical protein
MVNIDQVGITGLGSVRPRALALSQNDPGVRSQMARFELGRVVMDVLAESLPNELFNWTKDGEYVDFSSNEPHLSSEERELENEAFWTSHDGLTSEVIFHDRLKFLAAELARAYNQLDLGHVQKLIERMLWLEPVMDNENMLALYETLYVLDCLPVANLCSDYFIFDPGYMIVEASMEVLNAKRARRAAAGAFARPDSEAWYRVYEMLAILKWRGPEADKNRLMSVENLVDSYLSVERRCLDYLASHPAPDQVRNDKVRHELGWCLLQVTKAAMRHQPQLTKELIGHFNSLHGPILEREPGHFLRFASTQRIDPWYWDFELFKMCLERPVTDDEASLCYQWGVDAMRQKVRQDENLRSFRLGAKNQLEILVSTLRQDSPAHREVSRAS